MRARVLHSRITHSVTAAARRLLESTLALGGGKRHQQAWTREFVVSRVKGEEGTAVLTHGDRMSSMLASTSTSGHAPRSREALRRWRAAGPAQALDLQLGLEARRSVVRRRCDARSHRPGEVVLGRRRSFGAGARIGLPPRNERGSPAPRRSRSIAFTIVVLRRRDPEAVEIRSSGGDRPRSARRRAIAASRRARRVALAGQHANAES